MFKQIINWLPIFKLINQLKIQILNQIIKMLDHIRKTMKIIIKEIKVKVNILRSLGIINLIFKGQYFYTGY